METFFTIDWDFFLPHEMHNKQMKLPDGSTTHGALVYDWQMAEQRAPLFQTEIWVIRTGAFRRMGLDLAAETAPRGLEEFQEHMGDCNMGWYGDSHGWAGPVTRDYAEMNGPLRVVNFDAHHDLGYDHPKTVLASFKKTGNIHCDDWALIGLHKNWIKEYVLVYPDWLGKVEIGNNPYQHNSRVKIMTWSEYVAESEPQPENCGLYLCRSSAWAPPQHDAAFADFRDGLGIMDCLDCKFPGHTAFDVCEEREWKDEWVDEREEQFATIAALNKELLK